METPRLRIGALSKRTGVSEHVLRAWENRYGLLRPERSAGGYRLYSAADEWRVRRMLAHLDSGLSAAEAARAALADEQGAAAPQLLPDGDLMAALRQALDDLDDTAAHTVLDRALGTLTVETVLHQLVFPYLRELGERWASGEITVGQEHYASNLIRSRLLGLAVGWGSGSGPRALLACPPGELHDLPLIGFGVVLSRRGWRIAYLGPDTPVADLRQLADRLSPDLVVVAATVPDHFASITGELRDLASVHRLALAGAGAAPALASTVGGQFLDADPVTAALGESAQSIGR